MPFADTASAIGPFTVGQLNDLSLGLLGRGITFPGSIEQYDGPDGFFGHRQEALLVSGHFDLDMGPVTLTYVPGYQYLDAYLNVPIGNEGNLDAAGNPLTPINLRSSRVEKRTDHELRLANSSDSRFNWLLGAWYEWDSNSTFPGTYFGVVRTTISSEPGKTESYALFGQGTYSLTDSLRLTGGLRYSHDHKSVQFDGTFLPTVAIALQACATGPGTFDPGCLTDLAAVPDYSLPGGQKRSTAAGTVSITRSD